jgi:hypothetical protein
MLMKLLQVDAAVKGAAVCHLLLLHAATAGPFQTQKKSVFGVIYYRSQKPSTGRSLLSLSFKLQRQSAYRSQDFLISIST